MSIPKDKNPKAEAERLMDELAKFCNSNGWDFYGAIFTGRHNWFDHYREGGNNFIRQCTTISCTSPGLQMFLGFPEPETSDIAQASISKG